MSYKNLDIYNLAMDLFLEVHPLSFMLPKYELYELGSQLRRSSDSVVSNIVEGYGRRRYQLLGNWYDVLAIRLKLFSYTIQNSGSRLCLLAFQTISFKCGLVSPGSDSLRASNKNHRDLCSHEFFCFFFYGKKRKMMSSLYPELKVKFADLEERYNILGAKINRFVKYVEQNG
jgi:hypothetical protein